MRAWGLLHPREHAVGGPPAEAGAHRPPHRLVGDPAVASGAHERAATAARPPTNLDRATGRPVRCYEHPAPGDLVHVGVKTPGNSADGGGHRVHSRALGRTVGVSVHTWTAWGLVTSRAKRAPLDQEETRAVDGAVRRGAGERRACARIDACRSTSSFSWRSRSPPSSR
ncbi:hypothetical protein Arub01_47770 [Actinomadura rubrobrunea]|uniref:Uncharacterized protein n=1 Tax=Actinomadura rubrobrunea TaxID=115335 RepID=A0A9W6Q144_9ACTN|nr:hypothetical protein Arub01_47770 [Actinomadura rubrobrunea]